MAGLRQLETRLAEAGPVRDVEADMAACRKWLGTLVQAVARRNNPEVAGALRDLLKIGVRRIEVRWRTEPYGRRNRYVPVGGTVEMHGCNWSALPQLHGW